MLTILDHDIPLPQAWTVTDLPDAAGLVTLDENCRGELLELADVLTSNTLPIPVSYTHLTLPTILLV